MRATLSAARPSDLLALRKITDAARGLTSRLPECRAGSRTAADGQGLPYSRLVEF